MEGEAVDVKVEEVKVDVVDKVRLVDVVACRTEEVNLVGEVKLEEEDKLSEAAVVLDEGVASHPEVVYREATSDPDHQVVSPPHTPMVGKGRARRS